MFKKFVETLKNSDSNLLSAIGFILGFMGFVWYKTSFIYLLQMLVGIGLMFMLADCMQTIIEAYKRKQIAS